MRPLGTFHFVDAGRMAVKKNHELHFRHTTIYTNTHTVVLVNDRSARTLRRDTLLVYNARLPGYVVYVYQIFTIGDGRCGGEWWEG